jgi:hypothetical protein
LRGGPRGFRPGFPCPAVLRYLSRKTAQFRVRGCYPLRPGFPSGSTITQFCNFPTRRQADQARPYNPRTTTTAVYHIARVWALPFSLATTQGVEVSFLSSGYLDVSVPLLASSCPMYSGTGTRALPRVSFLIRKSPDQRLVSTSPRHIAAAHVLHRLLAPRHPPCALILLIEKNMLLMSLWSFQGARGLGVVYKHTSAHLQRSPLRPLHKPATPISQNSTAYWRTIPPRWNVPRASTRSTLI